MRDCGGAGCNARSRASRPTCGYLRQNRRRTTGFAAGGVTTSFLRSFHVSRNAIEVIDGGTRRRCRIIRGGSVIGTWACLPQGRWIRSRSASANRLVGNREGAPALEITVTGPSLSFHVATIALTGADFGARLDGAALVAVADGAVAAGSVLELAWRRARERGLIWRWPAGSMRRSIWVAQAHSFWGDSAEHAGRALRAGDVLGVRYCASGKRGALDCAARIRQHVDDRRALWPACRSGFLHRRRHRGIFRCYMEGASQLRPHRRTADRTQA